MLGQWLASVCTVHCAYGGGSSSDFEIMCPVVPRSVHGAESQLSVARFPSYFLYFRNMKYSHVAECPEEDAQTI